LVKIDKLRSPLVAITFATQLSFISLLDHYISAFVNFTAPNKGSNLHQWTDEEGFEVLNPATAQGFVAKLGFLAKYLT
jgi:hypothetical protein